MTVTTRTAVDAEILDLHGKITIGDGDTRLREVILNAVHSRRTRLLLDMGGVTARDSSDVGELVSSHTTASNRGVRLRRMNFPPVLTDVLILAQLYSVFDIYDSEEEALRGF